MVILSPRACTPFHAPGGMLLEQHFFTHEKRLREGFILVGDFYFERVWSLDIENVKGSEKEN